MKRAFLIVSALGCLAWAAPAAFGDVTIETKVGDRTARTYIAPHRLAGETREGTVIFRGDKKLLWSLDSKNKTYSELTQEDFQAMGSSMNDAMSQMQEAMKNMTPEQRAMMEKMMKGRMPEAPTQTKRTVKATGESKTINGFACSGYVVSKDDGTSIEMWATDPKALKLSADDLATCKEMADFIKTSVPQMGQLQDLVKDFAHPKENDVPGLPILSIQKDKGGQEISRAEIVKIESGAVPAERFEVPEGFTKQESPMK